MPFNLENCKTTNAKCLSVQSEIDEVHVKAVKNRAKKRSLKLGQPAEVSLDKNTSSSAK